MVSTKLAMVLIAFVVAVTMAYPTLELEEETHQFEHPGAHDVVEWDEVTGEHLLPIDGNDAGEYITPAVESSYRSKRATCDLLSAFNVGHAACAANCIRKGFKGGFCNGSAVCNCRR